MNRRSGGGASFPRGGAPPREPDARRSPRWSRIAGTSPSAAALILAAFLFAVFGTGPLLSALAPELEGYPRWGVRSGMQVAVCLLGVMALHRAGLLRALGELGLAASPLAGALVAAVATVPMLLAFGLTGPVAGDLDPVRLLFFVGVSPLTEEVVFRGFAFWLLYRRAGWGFWSAALVPTALFATLHLSQADRLLPSLGILGVTTIGGLWFSWLLLRWENLWVPFLVHAAMNGWWEVFDVDDTALGGGLANVARATTILVSIVVTLRWTGRRPTGDGTPPAAGAEGPASTGAGR